MDKKLNNLSKLYDHLEVSPKLDDVLQEAILRKRNRKVIYMQKTNRILKIAGTIAASLVLCVTVGTNINATFAQTLYDIPVVEKIARLVTVKNYDFENETSKGSVKIPAVDLDDNTLIQDKINNIIQEKVNAAVSEQAELDAEYKKAYLETGGKESEYHKVETTVDYKTYYSNDELLSFEVYKYQTLAPAYNENFYYTFSIETGTQLTLKDLLGDDFAQIVKEKVVAEMKTRMQEKPDQIYETKFYENTPIDESRSFYIDKDGNIIVTFAKYEVAAGYMGIQEFIVGQI